MIYIEENGEKEEKYCQKGGEPFLQVDEKVKIVVINARVYLLINKLIN